MEEKFNDFNPSVNDVCERIEKVFSILQKFKFFMNPVNLFHL